MRISFSLLSIAWIILTMSLSFARDEAAGDKDRATFAQLKKAGDDSSKDHQIDFFFVFSKEVAAKAALADLLKEGFRGELSARDGEYLITVTKKMKPAMVPLRRLREKFESIANKHGGTYDGWGTEVEK